MTTTAPPSPSPPLSPLAAKMLAALRSLTSHRQPAASGGFTLDDISFQMRTFSPEPADLYAAMDDLEAAGLVRFAGIDESAADDAPCYSLT